MAADAPTDDKLVKEHDTLKYSLLGPSLTKSGQDNVDQQKVLWVLSIPLVVFNKEIGLRDNLQRLKRLEILQQRREPRQEPHPKNRAHPYQEKPTREARPSI
jgi:DNA polymerase kappa